jgi:NAD-dependent DNA ligase
MITKEELDKYLEAYNRGEPLISDEEYDKLLEEYLAQNGESNRPYLRQQQSSNVNDVVGTLPKVYLSPRENQKSYDDWLRSKLVTPSTRVIVQPKFDGCSVAYDAMTDEYFTRGDYDNGESVNVTNLFKGYFKPENFASYNTQAIKC